MSYTKEDALHHWERKMHQDLKSAAMAREQVEKLRVELYNETHVRVL